MDGFAIYVCKSGELGRAHRSHRWGHRFESCCDHHNCTAILIQCVSGLRCSSFLPKPLCHRGFQALLHESPSLHPLRKPRKLVSTGVEPSALLHDCFLKGALLHDCSELSCNTNAILIGLSFFGNNIHSHLCQVQVRTDARCGGYAGVLKDIADHRHSKVVWGFHMVVHPIQTVWLSWKKA